MVESHRRAGVRNGRCELGHVEKGIVEGELDALRNAQLIGLRCASQCNLPGAGICHQLAHGDVEDCTWCAECDVAQELFPNHHVHVCKGPDVKPVVVPESLDLSDSLSHAAVHFADPYEPHPLVMDVTRLGY